MKTLWVLKPRAKSLDQRHALLGGNGSRMITLSGFQTDYRSHLLSNPVILKRGSETRAQSIQRHEKNGFKRICLGHLFNNARLIFQQFFWDMKRGHDSCKKCGLKQAVQIVESERIASSEVSPWRC